MSRDCCCSRYCAAAAELGDAVGQVNLGDLHYYGAGVKKDWAATFKLCVCALAVNCSGSMTLVPNCGCVTLALNSSCHVTRRCRYTQAADQGNAQAENSLAYCYRYGHGVKADKAQAVRLCVRAVG